jgi:LEA14-like dessication related protein
VKKPHIAWVASTVVLLSGCASQPAAVAPEVTLKNVSIVDIDHEAQSFVLGIDVHNPHPFPLVIDGVRYRIRLDGQRFANGDVRCSVEVPPAAEQTLEISVDLDLMRTAPQLLFVVRDGVRRQIDYRLVGDFDLTDSATPRVSFEDAGRIRLQAGVQ